MSQTNTLAKGSGRNYFPTQPLKSFLNSYNEQSLNEFCASIYSSAEKGHQMMPFLALLSQILFKDFPRACDNSK
ncbi:hypothetical protein OTK58_16010, partial [Vibrio barjaei]|nr:hypothetical protein [Vibrio barjaei]